MNELYLTNHLTERMSFRKINKKDIDTCLAFGETIHRTGVEFHILSKKVIKENQLSEKLNGLCVLVTSDRAVITAYKNSQAISNTKRLTKDNLTKFFN